MECNDHNNSEQNLTYSLALSTTIKKSLLAYLTPRKKGLIEGVDKSSLSFDFYLPDGLDTPVPVYIDVKSSLSTTQVEKLKSKINNLPNRNLLMQRIILIIGSGCSKANKLYYEASFQPSINGVSVEIWDTEDVPKFLGNSNNYQMIEENPSKILIQHAINNHESRSDTLESNNTFITQLKHEYEKEKVVLVLGAGVSISAGLPSWNQMISVLQAQMISHLVSEQNGLPSAKADQIKELASNYFYNINNGDSPLAQMRFIRSALSSKAYNQMVHKALYGSNKKTSKLLKAICKICKPTRSNAGVYGIITYNFDDLLEKALDSENIEYKDIFNDEDVSSTEYLNIFHVHGFLPEGMDNLQKKLDLIFSEEEYHDVYNKPYSWSNLVQINSFRDKTCVFIGSSLTDPNLRRLLDISSRKGETPRHFAFLKRPAVLSSSTSLSETVQSIYGEIIERLNNTYYKTLGLNIIWVDNLDDIPDLLLQLK